MKYFIIYIAIGIFLAFAFVVFNKVVENLKDGKLKRMLKHICLDPYDEFGFVLVCLMLIILWPIVIAFATLGAAVLLLLTIVTTIGVSIYNAGVWVGNKISKQN